VNVKSVKILPRRKRIIINGNEEQRLQVFSEPFDRIEDAETDVTYYKAILHG
jgi:hypothetical protein